MFDRMRRVWVPPLPPQPDSESESSNEGGGDVAAEDQRSEEPQHME
jgi:hypothetical protein